MAEELTIERRKQLVMAAIERIEAADAIHRKVQSDATSTIEERDNAKHQAWAIEQEFCWQWKNVKAILEEK